MLPTEPAKKASGTNTETTPTAMPVMPPEAWPVARAA
eukprot:gene20152-39794_t